MNSPAIDAYLDELLDLPVEPVTAAPAAANAPSMHVVPAAIDTRSTECRGVASKDQRHRQGKGPGKIFLQHRRSFHAMVPVLAFRRFAPSNVAASVTAS